MAVENKASISVTIMRIIIDTVKIYFEVVFVRTHFPGRTPREEAVVKMWEEIFSFVINKVY